MHNCPNLLAVQLLERLQVRDRLHTSCQQMREFLHQHCVSELLLEGKRVPDSASDKADCKRHGRLLCCAEHGVQQRVGTDCAASQPKALSLSRSQMVLARRLEQIALACQSSPHADAKLCCQSAHLHMMNSAPLARLMH